MVGIVQLKVQQPGLLFRLALTLMAFAGIGGILLASLCAADTERAKAETVPSEVVTMHVNHERLLTKLSQRVAVGKNLNKQALARAGRNESALYAYIRVGHTDAAGERCDD